MLYESENNAFTAADNINEKSESIGELEKLELIKKLKELLDIGAITKEEFIAKKKELLGLKANKIPNTKKFAILLWSSLGFTAFAYMINVIISLSVGGNLFWMFDYIMYGYIAGFICMGLGIVWYISSLLCSKKDKELKKTRIVSLILMVSLLCITFSPLLLHNPLKYNKNNDGTYSVTGCEYRRKNVNIRATYMGSPVTSIGNWAFSGHQKLISLKLADGITTIGENAFYESKNLESIIIPESVKYIKANAFIFCESLVIYCKAEEKPGGWSSDWNCINDYGNPIKENWKYATVYWKGEWEYDWRGNPVPIN